jgi:superkiller protein 3
MWRMLGDAYVKSGRHMAGLKALQKALEIDPSMWMAHYHMGETYMQLGDYAGAIAAFKEVDAATESAEVGVTAALAESTLALGRVSAAGGFRERSRSAFHAAIGYALRVLTSGRSHRAWAWKLIGDATLQLAEREVDPKDIESTAAVLHPVLEHLVSDDDDRRSSVAGLGHASNLLQAAPGPHYAVKAAVFAFAYRAHLLKNEHSANSALYDLGCALHTLATRDEEVRTPATKAAISAVRLALERDASDERLWNALGVICAAAGQQLAQHAFVVSLELYSKDPEVWTNLGFLYTREDDRELANQCFLKAQTLDPDCARAWFGQAVLAQRDGQYHASAGLFAHSATLSAGSLLEADLALALGAFGPFLTPHARDTTPLHQAAFALARYVAAHPEDSGAKHLQALVSERLGLTDLAVAALEDATKLLEDEFERSESAAVEANYATALLNLARVRLAAGNYGAALAAFTDAAELAASSSEERVTRQLAQARLGSALAHFWLHDLDASLEGFQSALDAAKNDDALTDEIAVLFARTLWSVGGEDAAEAAKTQLMES